MTSTMKSEPGTPPMREVDNSFGVPVSAAATCAVGGSAEGARAEALVEAVGAALAGGAALAAPATATPARNLRRLTAAPGCLRRINFLPFRAALRGRRRLNRTCYTLLSARRRAGKSSVWLHNNVYARGAVPMSREPQARVGSPASHYRLMRHYCLMSGVNGPRPPMFKHRCRPAAAAYCGSGRPPFQRSSARKH